MKLLTQNFALFGFLKVEEKKMVLGVWTDGFCTETVTLRYLSSTRVNVPFQLGACVLCWEKSINHIIFC